MTPKVALVSMPWAPYGEPSLGLGILKAQLTKDGVESRIFHFNLLLLRYLSSETYKFIASCWGLNDFLFSAVVDSQTSDAQLQRLAERCALHACNAPRSTYQDSAALGQLILHVRHQIIPAYLIDCAELVLEYEPTMVGFTCMFDQTIASAALASLIKEKKPDTQIVCGGYALEGPPGLEVIRAFPQIDCVALGDGEPVIGRLAEASIHKGSLSDIPGVLQCQHEQPHKLPLRAGLNSVPEPDYADWFEAVTELQRLDKITLKTQVLPVESSRGCWWGQEKHCVFCGIDDQTLLYRSKAPDVVLDQLSSLRQKYGDQVAFRFSDYILPHGYHKDLLPRLGSVNPLYTLVCEIKANQSPRHMESFAKAGFVELQPGIESFSSKVLKDMDKGVRGIQNVFLLKLGYLNRIQINYNILYGLPSDDASDYERLVQLIPRLYHLAPPVSRTEIIITRFAPLQSDPERFGIGASSHHDCYDVLFSDSFLQTTGFDLDNYSYYFNRPFAYRDELNLLYIDMVSEIECWKRQHREREVYLAYEVDEEKIRFRDARFGVEKERTFGGLIKAVYLSCDSSPTPIELIAKNLGTSSTDIRDAVNELDDLRLVWREDDVVVGLAVEDAVVKGHLATQWRKDWSSIFC